MVNTMDFGKTVGDSFEYAKEGLAGKWKKWLLLLISGVIFPLIMGYMMRIYRGANPSPEPDDWGTMFVDGIKLFVVGIIYALPVIILEIAIIGSAGLALFAAANPPVNTGAFHGTARGSYSRRDNSSGCRIHCRSHLNHSPGAFARTGSFGEAFNFGEILAHIGRIGWMNYIIALIIMVVIVGIVEVVCMAIPFIGLILLLILLPGIILFSSLYITLVYDSAGTP